MAKSPAPTWPHDRFNAYLEDLITAAGLADRADLSRQTGVSESQFSVWKSGRYRPSREKLRQIAEWFQQNQPTLNVTLISLELAAGLTTPEELGLSQEDTHRPSPPPAPLVGLHERWARASDELAAALMAQVEVINQWFDGQEALQAARGNRDRRGRSS